MPEISTNPLPATAGNPHTATIQTPLPLPTETQPASPTAELPTPAPSQQAIQPTIIATGDTLRFSFPTPGQPPVSIWRPPLYPVPWALSPNDHFLFTRPIAADVVNWALPNYRYGGIFTGTEIVHTGIDIDAPIETPVYAAGSGVVRWSGFGLYMNDQDQNDPYGLAVAIEHDFGFRGQKLYTIYAHMDRIDVRKGQHINIGDQIGIVGNTGNTTGPHLHFEIRLGENNYYSSRNPELWLSPPQGWGVLVGRILETDKSALEKQPLLVRSKTSGQSWEVITYGPVAVTQDEIYRENMVLSDLPEGDYTISTSYFGKIYRHNFSISPGAVTLIAFYGSRGFSTSQVATPSPTDWFVTPIPTP